MTQKTNPNQPEEEPKSWLLRVSDYLSETLPDRYGIFGIIPAVALLLASILLPIVTLVAVHEYFWPTPAERSMDCTEGHFTARQRLVGKTTRTVSVFVCDQE